MAVSTLSVWIDCCSDNFSPNVIAPPLLRYRVTLQDVIQLIPKPTILESETLPQALQLLTRQPLKIPRPFRHQKLTQ